MKNIERLVPEEYQIINSPIWRRFKEGALFIPNKKMWEKDKLRPTLRYGLDEGELKIPVLSIETPGYLHEVPINDLKKVVYAFPWFFVRINSRTRASRGFFGGLKVRRLGWNEEEIETTSIFPRREYNIIKRYF